MDIEQLNELQPVSTAAAHPILTQFLHQHTNQLTPNKHNNTAHDDNINQTTHSIVIHPYSAVSVDQPILPVDTFTMLSAIKQSIQPIDHNAFDIDNDT